jgi:hypothetical protein
MKKTWLLFVMLLFKLNITVFSQNIGVKVNYSLLKPYFIEQSHGKNFGIGFSYNKSKFKSKFINFDFALGTDINYNSFKTQWYIPLICQKNVFLPQCPNYSKNTYTHNIISGEINFAMYALHFINKKSNDDFKETHHFFIEMGLNIKKYYFSQAWIKEKGRIIDAGNGYRIELIEFPKISDLVCLGYSNDKISYRLQMESFIFDFLDYSTNAHLFNNISPTFKYDFGSIGISSRTLSFKVCYIFNS